MSNKPELIELLLSNLKEFEKKFQELLNRVPNIHSPNKVEFFTHFFLGSILTLSHSKLVKKCNIENILFKLIKNEQGLIKVVKLFFKAQEKLRFVTITTAQDVEHYDIDELKEIATKLEIKFIDEYDIQGKAFRIYTEESIEQQGKPFKLNTQNLKIKDGLQEKELCQAFKEVFDQPSTHTTGFSVVDLTSGEGFESDMLKLSNLDVNKVKGAVGQIFKKLASIYQELLNKTESAYHGFVYGFLAMNFKYKYDLDCYVERIEGKGYTDLILISRKDNRRNKNWKAIPVVVEFKAGKEIVDKAIKQIKDRGYLYTPLSMRTFAQRGVIAGVNFALNLAVAVEEVEIYQSQGFMNKLLSGISSLLGTKDIVQRDNIKNDLKETVEKEIKYLYFAASGVRTENYLSRLILGQMLATKVANGSKYIFIHNNQDFDFDDKDGIRKGKSKQVSTFIIKKQSESFVFSIVEYTGQEEKYNLTGKISTRRQKAAQDKEIFENQLVPDISNEYTQLNIKVEASSELTVDVSYVSDFANKEYQGKLVEIGDVIIDSFFGIKEGDSKDFTQGSQNETIKLLEKALFPRRDLIRSESHFQALMQGLLMNYRNEAERVFVFTEANPSGQGRIDLVISLFKEDINNNNENKIIVIELKYASGKSDSQNKFNEAKEQVEKYKTNLKTVSDEKKFTGLYMVFNVDAKNAEELIYYGTMLGDVDHSSQSEFSSESSGYATACSSEDESRGKKNQKGLLSGQKRLRPSESDEVEKRIKGLSLAKEKVVRFGDMCNQHGDYAPSGGVGGSSNVFVNGKPVHCQGDMWLWHASIDPNKPPHAGHFLLDGSKSVFVNGKAIARTGDKISCGAKVEQGSNDVFAG